jgi:hypothetical protein
MKTVAVVALTNYNDLINDITFIGELVGQPAIAQLVEGVIAQQTGGQGLVGVDKTKPWGLILQTDGAQFLPVVCLPVTNLDEFLAAIAATGADVKDEANGIKRLTLPDGNTALVKSEGGWAYAARNAAALARVPNDPQAEFAKLLADYDVAVHASAQNVPPMYRQIAILTVQSAMQQQLQRQANESEEDYKLRQKTVQAQMAQTVQQIQEMDSLTLGWLIDAQQEKSVLEMTYKFVPDGELAKQFAGYEEPRTNFAGFYQPDAAATFSFVTKADPKSLASNLAQMDTMLNGARAQFNKFVDEKIGTSDEAAKEAIKGAGGEFIDALATTIKSAHMDGGGAVHLSPDSLTLVAGARVEDSAKFEGGLKKLEEGFKSSPDAPTIEWNVASHDGVNFHTVSIPLPDAAELPAKLLGGQADIAFGIGPQAIYVAIGKEGVDAIKQAIDASKAEPNKLVPPFELAFSLGPIMEVAAAQAKDDAQRERVQGIADMLRNEALGRDHVRVVGQMIPNGLKYRLEAEEGALRAAGKAAIAAQQQAAAGQ